jgi:hypothetical protein
MKMRTVRKVAIVVAGQETSLLFMGVVAGKHQKRRTSEFDHNMSRAGPPAAGFQLCLLFALGLPVSLSDRHDHSQRPAVLFTLGASAGVWPSRPLYLRRM